MFPLGATTDSIVPLHILSAGLSSWLDLLHLSSDLLIATAYVAISATLALLVYRARRAVPFHWMFLAFGAFILGCGGTHFVHVGTRLGFDNIAVAGTIQVVTMLASLGVAVALPPLVPRVLALIADGRRAEEHKAALAHQATHDALTGLANRALFLDRLEHALARATRSGQSHAVLFLDLDSFKAINDSLGHAAGDTVLVESARRLETCVRAGDTVARFGGDEFAILLEDIEGPDLATQVAERIGNLIQRPIVAAGEEVAVSASVGISLSTGPDDRPEDLLRFADVAMYRAKSGGKAAYDIFYPGMPAAAEAAPPPATRPAITPQPSLGMGV